LTPMATPISAGVAVRQAGVQARMLSACPSRLGRRTEGASAGRHQATALPSAGRAETARWQWSHAAARHDWPQASGAHALKRWGSGVGPARRAGLRQEPGGAAKLGETGGRARADLGDDVGRGEASKPTRCAEIEPSADAIEQTGRVKISGTRGINNRR